MKKRLASSLFAGFGCLSAAAVMMGFALYVRLPAKAGQPPALAPAGSASVAAEPGCRPVGRLQNVGYTVAALGQGPAPTQLGVSTGPTLFVVGGVPVSWVGKPVLVCPAADGYPRRVCIDAVCVEQVVSDAGKP